MTDISLLSCDAFASLVGSALAFTAEDGSTFEATLDAASERPRSTPKGAPRTAFSLLFTAPAAIDHGHYTVTHPDLGPIGPLYVARVIPAVLGQEEAALEICFG